MLNPEEWKYVRSLVRDTLHNCTKLLRTEHAKALKDQNITDMKQLEEMYHYNQTILEKLEKGGM